MLEPESLSTAEIQQTVVEARYAATSATGPANIIVNYNYSGPVPPAPPPPTGASPKGDANPTCPYLGLYHFGPKDSAVFFGRDAVVETLHRAIQRRAVLPLLGDSGSGKSSVVFAGLVPRLEREGHWRCSTFRPGADPFHALARALVPLYAPSLDETEQMVHARKLAEELQKKDGLSLANVLAQVSHNAPQDKLLLIAEQFEELYSLCPDEGLRQAFLDALIEGFSPACINGSATDGSAPRPAARLLLTMRLDFLGSALAYRPFAEFFQQEGEGKGDVKLGPMNDKELREAIERPAADQSVFFESRLVERILRDVAAEPGHLPLLEFALTELWSLREGALLTHAAYTAIGGVEGALARHADGCLAALEPAEQQEARRVLLQLVRPGEGKADTRRLTTRKELGEDRWQLVQRLADDRLVVTSRNAAGDDTVEVVHEALIRHWDQLSRWVNNDRNFLVWRSGLRDAISTWNYNDREEDGLLRGRVLDLAKAQLQQRADDLDDVEKEFIAASASAAEEILQRERTRRKQAEKRRQLLLTALGIALTVVSMTLFLAGSQLVRAQHLRGEALAVSAKLTVNTRPADALFEALASSGFDKYRIFLNASKNPYPLLASSSEALIQGLGLNHEQNRFMGHLGDVRSVEFDCNGQRIVSAGEDGTVRLWDVHSGQQIGEPMRGHEGYVRSAAFSSDGQLIVSAGQDGTIRLWDAKGGHEIGYPLIGHQGGVLSAMFSQDGERIVSSGEDGTIRLWDVRSGEEDIAPLLGHQGWVRSAAFSQDGKWIVSAGEDGTVRIWDAMSGQMTIKPIRGHQGWVKTAAFSQDGERIVSAGYDGKVRIWDRKSGRPTLPPLRGHEGWVKSAAFSSDGYGKWIVSAGEDGTIRLWDSNTGQAVEKPFTGHQGWVLSARFSNDGEWIVSSGQDGTVRLWKLDQKGVNWRQFSGHQGKVGYASMDSDGEKIVSAGDDGTVRIWDFKQRQPSAMIMRGHQGSVKTASFSADGKQVVSAGEDGSVRLWDVVSGQSVGDPLIGHYGGVLMATFSNDGLMIVSGGEDGTIRRWDSMSGLEIGEPLQGHKGGVLTASFSNDGERIVSAGQDKTVFLWDTKSGRLIHRTSLEYRGWIISASFSTNGERIATVCDDGVIRIWDSLSGQNTGELIGDSQQGVRMASFSVDDQQIVTASYDGTVRLWDAKSLRAIGEPLRGHQGKVFAATFGKHDKRVVSAGEDGIVRLWDNELTDPIPLVCRSLATHNSLLHPYSYVQREAQRICRHWL
jgi:WD40 repeat protein